MLSRMGFGLYNKTIRKHARERWMESLIGLVLLINMLLGGLFLSDFALRTGGTMEERKAVVFEVYRYAVCFVMVVVFTFTGFQLLVALLTDAGNVQGLSGPGAGVLLSVILFLVHWFMKNPAYGKSTS
jgi:drug/metabolite transporter (DMT)-like permease